MVETAPPGFVARNNEVIGSILSLIALAASAGIGALLMFGTETRGVAAILTVLTVAGGLFTLALHAIHGVLRGLTPPEQWAGEESGWRATMGLDDANADADADNGARIAIPLAIVSVLIGLALSLI